MTERLTAGGLVIVVLNVSTSLLTIISPPPETVAVGETLAAAVGDDDGFVVKRVEWLANAAIGLGGSGVEFGGAFHFQSFMRTFIVELLDEGIELGLLLQDVLTSWSRGFFFEG